MYFGSATELTDNANSYVMKFFNGANTLWYMRPNGNLGNTSSPGYPIDINGTIRASNMKITATPTYADNTAALAGGLVAGDVYRTSTGILMITY
jgi:hypothetical protein